MAVSIASSGIVSRPSGSDLDGANGTMACRFRTSQANANIALMGRNASTNSEDGCMTFISAALDKCCGFANNSFNNNKFNLGNGAGPTVRDGNWHSMAMTFSMTLNVSCTLVVDGVTDSSANSAGGWSFGGQNVRHGLNQDAFWTTFIGDMAEMTWWNVQLTADELKAYTSGLTPRLIRPSALVYYIPAVRDVIDVKGSSLTLTNTTIGATHPRIVGNGF
jgi:hypothetical protein